MPIWHFRIQLVDIFRNFFSAILILDKEMSSHFQNFLRTTFIDKTPIKISANTRIDIKLIVGEELPIALIIYENPSPSYPTRKKWFCYGNKIMDNKYFFLLLQPKILLQQPNVLLIELKTLLL